MQSAGFICSSVCQRDLKALTHVSMLFGGEPRSWSRFGVQKEAALHLTHVVYGLDGEGERHALPQLGLREV